MVDEQSCRAAVATVVAAFDHLDDATRRKIPARTIGLEIPDLGLAWSARISPDGLEDVRELPPGSLPDTEVGFAMDADTLIDLVDGRLPFPRAFGSGKVRVSAGWRDVLALRAFL